MGVSNFHELYEHAGHQVEVVTYGKHGKTVNVAIECTDCNAVLLDFDRFPEDVNILKEYPAWVEELYAGWAVDEWPDEYLKIAIAEMSDDVDCSSSTIVDRATRLSYLADQLSEEVVDALDKAALEIVKYTGYASGTPWKED